jgi:hypothetical protein
MSPEAIAPILMVAIVAAAASLVGVAIGAAVSLRTNTRNIKVENITKERAKWRDNVREKALWVHKAAVAKDISALEEHHLAFTLILNPIDTEDRSILSLIQRLKTTADEPRLTELADRIALLLKHDWQRAKWEAEGMKKLEPVRIAYAEFRRRRSPDDQAVTIPS